MASNPHTKDNDEKRADFSPLSLEQRAWGLWKVVQKHIDEGIPVVVKVWSSSNRCYYRLGTQKSQFDSPDAVLRSLEKLRTRGCI